MPSVSIVIRAFNEARHLPKLLQTIEAQDYAGEVETIVVDSGSTDGTRDIAGSYHTKLICIEPSTFSFGYALNRGIAAACGEIILIISAHCYPQNHDWITQMVAPFKDTKVGLVYGKQRGNHLSRFSEHQIFRQWFPDRPDPRTAFPFCNNANAAIRRSLWETYPYDESLTGLEDIAWAKGLVEKGFGVYYNPSASVFHLHEEDFAKVLNRYRREAIAFCNIFPKSRFSLWDFAKLTMLNIANDYARAFREGLFWKVSIDVPAFRVAQFWGTYSGHRQTDHLSTELRMRMYYPPQFLNARKPSGTLPPSMSGKESES